MRPSRGTQACTSAGERAEVLPLRRLPPPPTGGPGDAHSNQEWIWQRERYLALFGGRPRAPSWGEHAVLSLPPRRPPTDRGRRAGRQADRDLARPRRPRLHQLDAPVDGRPRALARWSRPCARAPRVDAGWAPFWHYRGLGCMAGKSPTSSTTSRPSKCSCSATRTRGQPAATLDRLCRFLGVTRGPWTGSGRQLAAVRPGRAAHQGPRPVIRTGAAVGSLPARGLAQGQQAADRPAPPRWRPAPVHGCRPSTAPPARAPPGGHRAAGEGHGGVVRGLEGLPRRQHVRQPEDARPLVTVTGDQVVRAVRPRDLEVVARRAVGHRHGAGVAAGAVGVRRTHGRRRRARSPPSSWRRHPGGLVPVVLRRGRPS